MSLGGRFTRLSRLLFHAAIVLVPTLAAALLAGLWTIERDAAQRREGKLAEASAIAARVDAFLERKRTAVEVLAQSHALTVAGNLAQFRGEAERVADRLGGWIVLARSGSLHDIIMTTRLPEGAASIPSAPRGLADPEAVAAEVRSRASGRPEVVDPFPGADGGAPASAVVTPVRGAGRDLFLYLSFDAARLSEILRSVRLADGAEATLSDARGRIIARSARPDEAAAEVAPDWAVELLRDRPTWTGTPPTAETRGGHVALMRLPGTPGWFVMISKTALPAPLSHAVLWAPTAAGLGVFLLCFVGLRAVRRTRRLSRRAETERLRAEELRAARDAARDAEAENLRLLAVLAHEVRTPLLGLQGALEVLADPRDPLRASETLRLAKGSAAGLLRLVDDVLELARIGAARAAPQPVRFDPGQMLRDVAAIVATEATRNGNCVRLAAPDPCPALIGDEGRIRRVVLNFASNAVKFTRNGVVHLSVAVAPHAQAEARVVFSVADTGIGIAPEDQARLFTDFGKLERSAELSPHGLGLGLAICRRLAARLGGEVQVESRLGEGAVFRFALTLPLAGPTAPADPGAGGGPEAARPSGPPPAPLGTA